MKEETDKKTSIENKNCQFSFKINIELYKRLDTYIKKIKKLEGTGFTRQRWIQEAIKDHLKSVLKIEENISSEEKYLGFQVPATLLKKIEKQANASKISKREWFLEAFQKKLDRDEKKLQKLLKELAQSSQKNHIEV